MSRGSPAETATARRDAAEPWSAQGTGGVAALVGLVVALAYARSVRFGFVYDDGVLFARQPVRRGLRELLAVLAEPHWPHLPYWRPLARFTLELQKSVHGPVPWAFHLVNALLAGLAVAAAHALVARRAFGLSRPVAALVALLFGLHPVLSSCAWPIAGREALLASALSCAALAAWLDGGRAGRAAALALAFLASCAREQALVLPALFLVLDATGLSADGRPRGARAWLARHAPAWAAAGLWLVLRARVLAGAGAGGGLELALLERPLGPLLSLAYALSTLAAPRLPLAYEPPVAVWAGAPRLALAALVLAPCAWLLARGARALGRRGIALALLFLLALAPTANVLRQEAPFAERHLAFASLFAFTALGAAADALAPAARKRALGALLLAALVAAAVGQARGGTFADDLTFLARWAREVPDSAQARGALGCVLFERGRSAEAERELRASLALDPDFVDGHANLGALLVARGALDEGLPHLRAAVHARPDVAHYRANLGLALLESGKPELAARHLERATELAPGPALPWVGLGRAREALGEREAARAAYARALERNPSLAEARARLVALGG